MATAPVKTEVADRLIAIIKPIIADESARMTTELAAALATIEAKLAAIGTAVEKHNSIIARLDTLEDAVKKHHADLETRVAALEHANRMKKVAPGLIINDRRPEDLFRPDADY